MYKAVKIIGAAIIFACIALASSTVAAKTGEELYAEHCAVCHGKDGKGDGPAAELLSPRPRKLIDGIYKYKSTPFDELNPSGDDIYRTIKEGLNGTAMPKWGDVLAEAEMRSLVEYLIKIGKLEKPKKDSVKYNGPKGALDIERAKSLFKERCAECHGKEGRGNPSKRLKDDWGQTVWPRNFTLPSTFRGGTTVDYIYARITVGTPGTPMPSYDDPENDKRLSEVDRWLLAQYVFSLNTEKAGNEGDTINAAFIPGEIPETTGNTLWDKSEGKWVTLAPQLIGGDRLYATTIRKIRTRVLYNEKDIGLLVEWDDPTESIPGDKKAKDIAGGDIFQDSIALEFPALPSGGEEVRVPHFAMGSPAEEVIIWQWKNASSGGSGEVEALKARGIKDVTRLGRIEGASSRSEYKDGAWRVIIKMPLHVAEKNGLRVAGVPSVPITFSAWDGSNFEHGSKHSITDWKKLVFVKGAGSGRKFIFPVVVVLAFLLEIAWLMTRD